VRNPTRNYLGTGWKFPPRLDSRGRIELVSQEYDIEEAVYLILPTRKGERQMRPEFGSELHRLAFAPNNAATAGLARRYVIEALSFWEPRIEDIEVDASADPAHPERLLLSITYRIIANNSERNLVFPFYLIPGEG
jgi:phage baseplate assembly protein W